MLHDGDILAPVGRAVRLGCSAPISRGSLDLARHLGVFTESDRVGKNKLQDIAGYCRILQSRDAKFRVSTFWLMAVGCWVFSPTK